MNAPVSAAMLQLRAGTIAAPVREGDEPLDAVLVVMQPTVPATAQLLRMGYEHGGLRLDLYGTLEADGYEVEHAALSGAADRIDVAVWLTREQLREMSDWCDRKMPSAHALNMVSQQEARAERMQWQCNFGLAPP